MRSGGLFSGAIRRRVGSGASLKSLGVILATFLGVFDSLLNTAFSVFAIVKAAKVPVASHAKAHRPAELIAVRSGIVWVIRVAFWAMRLCLVWVHGTTLRNTIRRVVGICAEKKVRRIDAGRVVASVANQHPIGDISKMQHPRHPMRSERLAFDRYMTVAPLVMGRTRPNPTGIGLVDLVEETLGKCFSHNVKLTHPTARGNLISLAVA